MKNGKRHARGLWLRLREGGDVLYECWWAEDIPMNGRLIKGNGDVYTGGFNDFYNAHGHGKCLYAPDGKTY